MCWGRAAVVSASSKVDPGEPRGERFHRCCDHTSFADQPTRWCGRGRSRIGIAFETLDTERLRWLMPMLLPRS
jgi:hypothetical protein